MHNHACLCRRLKEGILDEVAHYYMREGIYSPLTLNLLDGWYALPGTSHYWVSIEP